MTQQQWAVLQQLASDVAWIKKTLAMVYTKEMMLMATLDDLTTAVAAETTEENSMVVLLNGMKAQLTTALANVGITPAQQLVIDNLFNQTTANSAALVTAIAANTTTPPVTPPTPAPAPVVSETKKDKK